MKKITILSIMLLLLFTISTRVEAGGMAQPGQHLRLKKTVEKKETQPILPREEEKETIEKEVTVVNYEQSFGYIDFIAWALGAVGGICSGLGRRRGVRLILFLMLLFTPICSLLFCTIKSLPLHGALIHLTLVLAAYLIGMCLRGKSTSQKEQLQFAM